MAQMGFGTILREAREMKGYDLASAARRLRIRVDILRAIEEEDFSRMPPRGYARSMVNAYARLVGLNPSEITKMYLDEAYAYQVGRARTSTTRENQFDMGPSSRRAAQTAAWRGLADNRSNEQGKFERAMFDDRRDYVQDELPDSFREGKRAARERTHPSRNTILPNRPTTNLYAGPRSSGIFGGKLPFIIGAVILIVLLIIVLAFAFGGKNTPPEDAPKVPITGVTDTTGTTTEDAAVQQTPAEQPPTSVKVTYEVATGKEAYLAITIDGVSQDATCVGGETESFDVTDKFTIATFRPDDVTVTVDGKPAEFVQEASGKMPSITVDFQTYLAEWEQAHPNAPKTSTAATGQSANTSSGGAAGASTPADSNATSSGSGVSTTNSSGSQGTTTTGTTSSGTTSGSSAGTST